MACGGDKSDGLRRGDDGHGDGDGGSDGDGDGDEDGAGNLPA